MFRSAQYANGLKKLAQVKYATKWKCEKLAVVVQVPQTTQNLVISRCCLAEDGKEMNKKLKRTCTAIVLIIELFV